MSTGLVKTKDGAIIYLYRATTENSDLSATEYLPETRFAIGATSRTPSIDDDTSVDAIPILNGIINDNGANTMTGSSGGNNSTNNITIFKFGGGMTDYTAQNLITNTTNVSKRWSISNLATAGTVITQTNYCGFWLYILNQTTLDYFTTSNCVELQLGTNSSNYRYARWNKAQLSLGWNWLSIYPDTVGDLLATGTPGTGTLAYFQLRITTNAAANSWAAGGVVYDLLRTFNDTHIYKDYISGYPSLNLSTLEVTKRAYLNSVEAVGYNLKTYGDFNEDSSRLMGTSGNMTPRSKSEEDEFIIITKERIIL